MPLRVANIQYGQILVSEVPAKPMFDWTCRDRALRVARAEAIRALALEYGARMSALLQDEIGIAIAIEVGYKYW